MSKHRSRSLEILIKCLSFLYPKVANVFPAEQTIWKAFRDLDLPQCLLLNLFIFHCVEATHPFLQVGFLFSHSSHHRLIFNFFFLFFFSIISL